MLTAKIDVTKIDKERLYKGEKGTYLNCVFIETPDSEYGDYMIVQEIPKEERKAGKKGPIIGNAKILVKKDAGEPDAPEAETPDDLPF